MRTKTFLLSGLLALSCFGNGTAADDAEPDRDGSLAAGFRYSTYGPGYDPGPRYWVQVGERMAARFSGATPQAIWIVGRLHGEGTLLSFPAPAEHPLIAVTEDDTNEETLALFDRIGLEVWLQVEPGNAPVAELIHLVLERYGHHPSVVGVGVDVEWYRSVDRAEGQAVTDEEATAWLQAARSHSPRFGLFLKHWLIEKMPPTVRDGIFFVDDSQIFPSLDAMVGEFSEWGRAFSPAPVGFQYGYKSDRPWWRKLDDPPADIGRRILDAVPNARGLYWVDFTVLEVFAPELVPPPDPMIGVKIYEYEGDFGELFKEWQALVGEDRTLHSGQGGLPDGREARRGRVRRGSAGSAQTSLPGRGLLVVGRPGAGGREEACRPRGVGEDHGALSSTGPTRRTPSLARPRASRAGATGSFCRARVSGL